MHKEFVPYEESQILKELGFDEHCLVYYDLWEGLQNILNHNGDRLVDAPTFSQAFDWFEKKHGLYYAIHPELYADGINFNWNLSWYLPKEKWTKNTISDGTYWYGDNGEYPTQRDAELGVLRKMIDKIKEEYNGKKDNN